VGSPWAIPGGREYFFEKAKDHEREVESGRCWISASTGANCFS
jgi:hypothetical protein